MKVSWDEASGKQEVDPSPTWVEHAYLVKFAEALSALEVRFNVKFTACDFEIEVPQPLKHKLPRF